MCDGVGNRDEREIERPDEFILRVEAKDSPEGDCVRWKEPKIVQAE